MLEPQNNYGRKKQLTCLWVGGQRMLTSGLGQLCGPCLWQGGGEAERREAGTGALWLGCQLPPHLGALDPWSLLTHSPQLPPSGLLPPDPCPASGHSPLGAYLLQTPAAPALALGPQAEEMELEGHLRCVKKNKNRNWRRKWQPTPGFLPGESPWTEEPGGL